MGSHSVTCHPTEVRIPPLPRAKAGTRFSDPGGMQCWDDVLCKVDRPKIEPTTCQSQVQCPTAVPPHTMTLWRTHLFNSHSFLELLWDGDKWLQQLECPSSCPTNSQNINWQDDWPQTTNYKKPALTRVHKPTSALVFVPRDLHL